MRDGLKKKLKSLLEKERKVKDSCKEYLDTFESGVTNGATTGAV